MIGQCLQSLPSLLKPSSSSFTLTQTHTHTHTHTHTDTHTHTSLYGAFDYRALIYRWPAELLHDNCQATERLLNSASAVPKTACILLCSLIDFTFVCPFNWSTLFTLEDYLPNTGRQLNSASAVPKTVCIWLCSLIDFTFGMSIQLVCGLFTLEEYLPLRGP